MFFSDKVNPPPMTQPGLFAERTYILNVRDFIDISEDDKS